MFNLDMPQTKRRSKSLSINKKRKTVRNARSLERPINIKTNIVGKGAYGIVTRPPARCHKFFSNTPNKEYSNRVHFKNKYLNNLDYISKLTDRISAENELEIANAIKDNIKNWNDFFCLIEFICSAPPDKIVQIGVTDFLTTYAIAPYGGVPLQNIFENKVVMSPRSAYCLIHAAQKLIEGIDELHSIYIYHNDIHSYNILYNPKDRKLRLIDFGNAQDYYSSIKRIGKKHPFITRANVIDSEQIIYNIIQPIIDYLYSFSFGDNIKFRDFVSSLEDAPDYNEMKRLDIETLQPIYVNYIKNFLDVSLPDFEC